MPAPQGFPRDWDPYTSTDTEEWHGRDAREYVGRGTDDNPRLLALEERMGRMEERFGAVEEGVTRMERMLQAALSLLRAGQAQESSESSTHAAATPSTW